MDAKAEIASLKKKHLQLHRIADELSSMRSWFSDHQDDMASEVEWVNIDDIVTEVKDVQRGVAIAIFDLEKQCD